MKVGIMGGTFNPIHNGHLKLAEVALAQAKLDEIWFMPSGLPAHKSNSELLSSEERLHMVKLALDSIAGFKASSFEIDREGFTYTADTMVALKEEYPDYEFFFIIGGDSLMKFHRWVKPEVISAHVTLLAAGRNGYSKEELLKQSEYLQQHFGTKICYLEMPEFPVSSSEIRLHCKEGRYDELTKAVPVAVSDYIRKQHLYQKTDRE